LTESKPYASNRLNPPGAAQLLADRGNVRIQSFGGAKPVGVPHIVEDVAASTDSARILGEVNEELKFGGCEVDICPA
jgi:hypothetical protein